MGMGYYTCCYGDLLGQTRLGVGGERFVGLTFQITVHPWGVRRSQGVRSLRPLSLN